ncbi:PREDICTED: uncharacterized protein LOC104759967 [Camelina sativa]|uniref:Uncharacterized protein LOC104759967 n=1 Tax=Camelina sativa TaxID=90675 RepID=A0ABM0X5Q1_CAMSA|nr:PREDICTED: uncharacterized protein LOC104759967 [Camelina sativa]
MRDLKHCLINSRLSDLPFCGNAFTWSNKHAIDPISKKLDRTLINDEWMVAFPNSLGVFGEPGFSDHSPSCVFLDTGKLKIHKPFKFLTLLNDNEEFGPLIKLWWQALTFDCSKMLLVSKKLKALKRVIKDFSHDNYSDLEKRTSEAFENLQTCQQTLLASPSALSSQLEKEAHMKWCILASAEESFLRQKSRICWLENGDKNSKFFHRVVLSRQAQNHILFLLDDNHQVVESKLGIQQLAVDFYKTLLGSKGPVQSPSIDAIEDIISQRCSASAIQILSRPFTPEEIKTVGADMIAAVMEFYHSGQILKKWNATLLTLIPKSPSASKMTEFRPIACCNSIYKATELVQGYNQKNISERGMLKVDLKKAFDSVNWDFIICILKVMGFPQHFVQLITKCITTTSFSVSINGKSCGFIKGAKGLRQGDSISPYLFTLAMERASLQNITKVLQDFSVLSGLSMNKDKTDLYLAGVNQDETLRIGTLGFNLGSLPIRYLGLPLMHRKLQICDYSPLLDKISAKFSSWSAHALSYAGRKALITSVIYGVVNFWASAFILPKGCIKSIESMCSRFLWCGDITKKPAAKVAWQDLCLPLEEGGLGFRCFARWNKTLCLKLIWRMLTARDSLWADWMRNNKIKDGVFWQIDEKKQTSWTWKTLLHLRPLALQFLRCQVGNGRKVSFWSDWWSPFGPLLDFMGATGPSQTGIPLQKTVADACTPEGWLLRHARSPQAELLQTYLTTVPLPSLSCEPDRYTWKTDTVELDQFSTKKTWDILRQKHNPRSWSRQVWFKGAIPRHAFMMWLMHLDRLPTQTRLAS